MIVGDFNEILEIHEKWGGEKFNPQRARDACDFMDSMSMLDLRSIGPAFTSSNRRKGLAHIKERVDKPILGGTYSWRWSSLYSLPEGLIMLLFSSLEILKPPTP